MSDNFAIALLSIGIALLLLGIVGSVEAFQIKAVTDKKWIRIVLAILGLFFIFWATHTQNMNEIIELQQWQFEQYQKQ